MNAIILHDAFVCAGHAGQHRPEQAVTVEAGAICTRRAGRYVQRRMHDRGGRGPDPEWRHRKFFKGLRNGCGEFVGGGDRHRPFQMSDGGIEILHFERGAAAVRIWCARRATDSQRIRPKFIRGPLAVISIGHGGWLQGWS